jgi:intracellular sulfur oxidation DsrE/DsrF family protein
MKKITVFLITGLIAFVSYSQSSDLDSALKEINFKKDSTLTAMFRADSIKVENEFEQKIKIAKFKSVVMFPTLKAGPFSGVLPVENITEVPDPTLDYKLLFELVKNQPDSISGMNADLVEIARVINLHTASGIPVEKLFPVILVHGPALNAFTTNTFYNEKFKKDNPNLKIINDLEALGAKFIACGQAMQFFDVPKEALLPLFKVSLTAQTVLSSYQMKGYVKYW